MAHNHERAAAARARTLELHEQRTRPASVPELVEPELVAAWHSLQLHWLKACPGYRQALRERVSEAAKRAERKAKRHDRAYRDVDYIGREVEGCG